MAVKPRNLGLTYQDKTGVRKMREWRGIKDTLIDYGWWCVMWKDMIKFVLQSPIQVVKGIFRYRWMLTYLALPQFIDRQLEGMRGTQLKAGHMLYDVIISTPSTSLPIPSTPTRRSAAARLWQTASSASTSSCRRSSWRASPTSSASPSRPSPSSFPP